MRRIRKLRVELFGHDYPGVSNMFEQIGYWPKPKWMRWTTFYMKRDKINELEEQYWPMVDAKIESVNLLL